MAYVEYAALKSEKEQLKMYLATAENREKQLQKHLEEEQEEKKCMKIYKCVSPWSSWHHTD